MATVRARFRFHGELNGLLPPPLRTDEFIHAAGQTDTLKHVIESLGVPHTEVARITVNGTTAQNGTPVHEGDLVDVWPYELPVDIGEARFVLDGHLGRLAAYLRMLGFDVWYDRYADDVRLARIAQEERRVLLTRDVGLLKRKEVERGHLIRAHKPHDQLRDVIRRFGLTDQLLPFTRCMACNGELIPVAKSEVEDLLPPHTRLTRTEFKRCTICAKVYWKGSHHAAMLRQIESLTGR